MLFEWYVMGYTRRQLKDLFDALLEFAEIRDLFDAPLRTYSSGMMARLGFSVATAVIPEVLIVDEVLSVGDIAFQEKSGARIRSFREQGSTILLVSHGMSNIKSMCDRAAWLSHGELVQVGKADEVVTKFEEYMGVVPQ